MTKLNHDELFNQSKNLVPGGVHSPVRSFKGLDLSPRFFQSAKGAYITDIEGKDYIDFCMSFGPLIHGHQDEEIKEVAKQALDKGWSYGACEPYSLDLAKYILDRVPFVDKIRFVNSGTEAVMTALRLARGATKRNKIIKFNGCYHGHMDSMLIKAGSGLAGETNPSSAGVPEDVAKNTLIVELEDEAAIKEIFARHPDEIAAIIIEPLPANNGLLWQYKKFLQFLRDITTQYGSLLIFDEVISGFRVKFGGMAELTGITPDIVTYGKIIGGGFPVGALAAKNEIMDHLAPIGQVYQAGTLSANPLAMVAGLKNLEKIQNSDYQLLRERTEKISQLFEKWLTEFNDGQFADIKITRFASLFWFSTAQYLTKACDIPADQNEKFKPMFHELLKRGIYLAPNAYEVGFVSLAHDDQLIEELERRLFNL